MQTIKLKLGEKVIVVGECGKGVSILYTDITEDKNLIINSI